MQHSQLVSNTQQIKLQRNQFFERVNFMKGQIVLQGTVSNIIYISVK